MVLLALEIRTRTGFYSHNLKIREMLAVSSRIFNFSSLALSRTFFFLACLSSHERKNRICEEKKNLCVAYIKYR